MHDVIIQFITLKHEVPFPTELVVDCTFCHSEPGLHREKCFEEYYTKLDYSH